MRMVLPIKSIAASIATFAVCLLIGLSLNHAAKAVDFSWLTSGDLQVVSETSLPSHFTIARPGCYESTITIREMEGIIPRTRQAEACVVMGAGMSVAYSGDTYIRYGADSYFYKLASSNWASLFIVPGTNRGMYLQQYSQYSGSALSVFDAINTHLHFDNQALMYGFSDFSHRLYPVYDDNTSTTDDDIGVSNAFFSNNGRFLVYTKHGSYPVQDRYVRVDLQTGEAKQFGRGWYVYEYSPFPGPQFAVSNDGNRIIGGGITRLKAWEINEDCLIDPPSYMDNSSVSNCPNHEIFPESYGKTTDPQSRDAVNRLLFNDDATELSFQYRDPENNFSAITVSPVGYVSTSKLDYLALGDSYSSGEGDFTLNASDNHMRFLPYTDEESYPQEMCHTSYSSYPLRLRDFYRIADFSMHSIACSGAKTIDVDINANPLLGAVDQYHGQNDRLQYFPREKEYQDKALTDFVPGRIPQIEFVKEYKPKVVTIGIGGNDVSFAPLIMSCAQDVNVVCPEAAKDGEERQRLARLIHSEFYVLRNLYLNIHNASPSTKVYVIGYPQFIADSSAPCIGNAGFTNSDERHLMNEATHYMNMVIRAAADSAGAYYVDIEDSLNGGELCQGIFTDYVTGVRKEWWIQALGMNSLNEYLYHPNAAGHRKMAEMIEQNIGSDFLTQDSWIPDFTTQPPAYTDYFAGAYEQGDYTTLSIDSIQPKIVTQGYPVQVSSPEYTYQPYTTVTVTRYSSPESLGNYAVDGKGRLAFSMNIPSEFPVGTHTLVFDGKSISGEKVQYISSFFVKGSNPDDLNANGIKDIDDKCLFVEPLGNDVDNDGIDDACDDLIVQSVNSSVEGDLPSEASNRVVESTQSRNTLPEWKTNNLDKSSSILFDIGKQGIKAQPKDEASQIEVKRSATSSQAGALTLGIISLMVLSIYVLKKVRKRNSL